MLGISENKAHSLNFSLKFQNSNFVIISVYIMLIFLY